MKSNDQMSHNQLLTIYIRCRVSTSDPFQGNKGIKDRLESATINKFMFDDKIFVHC